VFGSDIRLNLQATQYGDILDVDFVGPLQTTTIAEKCTLRMVEQFNFLRVNATKPLATFLDYITYIFFV
jgi:V-type H+-transporting ATPase subunit d